MEKFLDRLGSVYARQGKSRVTEQGQHTLALVPGASNVLCWRNDSDPTVMGIIPNTFSGHLDNVANRENVKGARIVGTQPSELSLVNSADQNKGFWEAARIPTSALDYKFYHERPRETPLQPATAASEQDVSGGPRWKERKKEKKYEQTNACLLRKKLPLSLCGPQLKNNTPTYTVTVTGSTKSP